MALNQFFSRLFQLHSGIFNKQALPLLIVTLQGSKENDEYQ